MKIAIDSERCQGHALCAGHIPDLVDYDGQGYAVAAETAVPTELEDAARYAAAGCPERAIRLSD